jgi:hypothetical protein
VDGKKRSIEHARTKVVNKHRRTLDQGEHRVLLQLHIFGDLQIEVHLRFPSVRAKYTATGMNTRTADFAIRVTRARGSSKFSIPSETASCCACADAGVLAVSFRGMAGSRIKANGEMLTGDTQWGDEMRAWNVISFSGHLKNTGVTESGVAATSHWHPSILSSCSFAVVQALQHSCSLVLVSEAEARIYFL